MDKKYLPSKKFVSRLIIILLVIGIAFLFSKVSPKLKEKISKNRELRGLSVGELVQNDENKNGIADWEEILFGLDPNNNGEENKAIILAKKKELGTDELSNNENLSQNDRLSRELFAIITSLQQTGNLNENSIENIATALDKKLNSEPILDIYTKDMLKVKTTNQQVVESYYNSFGEIAIKYADSEIGDELLYISQALLNEDKKAMEIAREIARKYEDFGKDLVNIDGIPSSLADTHLELANDYHKTSVSIQRMSVMIEDPLFGMNAIVDYKNNSEKLVSNLEKIGVFFEKSVIIER